MILWRYFRKNVDSLNEICCKVYSEGKHVTHRNKKTLWFEPGDKICVTKNGTVTVLVPESAGDVDDLQCDADAEDKPETNARKLRERKLYNGEIFFLESADVS